MVSGNIAKGLTFMRTSESMATGIGHCTVRSALNVGAAKGAWINMGGATEAVKAEALSIWAVASTSINGAMR